MLYLYIKTHNITGLKYLGKTSQNPYHYSGSGKYWKNHLKVHGNDVLTSILLMTEDKNELKETGIFFSNLWNVTNSKDWANLRNEEGDGGDTSAFINYSRASKLKGRTYEDIHGENKAKQLKKSRGDTSTRIRKNKTYEDLYGFERAEKLKKAASERQSRLNVGRKHSEATKKKLRESALKRFQSKDL